MKRQLKIAFCLIAAFALIIPPGFAQGTMASPQGVATGVPGSISQLDAAASGVSKTPVSGPKGHRVGVAAGVTGAVQIEGRKLKSGDVIHQGDVVTTAEGAQLQILLLDETVFTVSEGSRVVIDEFVYDPVKEGGKIHFSLLKGFFRYVSGKIEREKSENVKIELPTATLGIRGTIVEGGFLDGESIAVLMGPGENNNGRAKQGSFIMRPKGGNDSAWVKRVGFGVKVDAEGNLSGVFHMADGLQHTPLGRSDSTVKKRENQDVVGDEPGAHEEGEAGADDGTENHEGQRSERRGGDGDGDGTESHRDNPPHEQGDEPGTREGDGDTATDGGGTRLGDGDTGTDGGGTRLGDGDTGTDGGNTTFGEGDTGTDGGGTRLGDGDTGTDGGGTTFGDGDTGTDGGNTTFGDGGAGTTDGGGTTFGDGGAGTTDGGGTTFGDGGAGTTDGGGTTFGDGGGTAFSDGGAGTTDGGGTTFGDGGAGTTDGGGTTFGDGGGTAFGDGGGTSTGGGDLTNTTFSDGDVGTIGTVSGTDTAIAGDDANVQTDIDGFSNNLGDETTNASQEQTDEETLANNSDGNGNPIPPGTFIDPRTNTQFETGLARTEDLLRLSQVQTGVFFFHESGTFTQTKMAGTDGHDIQGSLEVRWEVDFGAREVGGDAGGNFVKFNTTSDGGNINKELQLVSKNFTDATGDHAHFLHDMSADSTTVDININNTEDGIAKHGSTDVHYDDGPNAGHGHVSGPIHM